MSADTVEETSDAFLENLGTIEVIVLRCKDAPQPPVNVPASRASTVEESIRSSRENTSKPTSRPASKQSSKQCSRHEQKEPSVKAKAPSKEPSAKEKIPSKVPSKVESKTAPNPPTAKTESEIGGFFGLFDGASDDPSIQPKPYWSDWNKRPVNNGPHPSRRDLMYIAPEDPLPSVPKAVARSKHVEHQVKTGKGAQYLHLCARPEYLDSMQKPYAVFTFKYRSKRVIEKKFKIAIKEEGEHLKAKLADMSKDELAEELYRLRVSIPCPSQVTNTNRNRWPARKAAAARRPLPPTRSPPPQSLPPTRPHQPSQKQPQRTFHLHKATPGKCPLIRHPQRPPQRSPRRPRPLPPCPGMPLLKLTGALLLHLNSPGTLPLLKLTGAVLPHPNSPGTLPLLPLQSQPLNTPPRHLPRHSPRRHRKRQRKLQAVSQHPRTHSLKQPQEHQATTPVTRASLPQRHPPPDPTEKPTMQLQQETIGTKHQPPLLETGDRRTQTLQVGMLLPPAKAVMPHGEALLQMQKQTRVLLSHGNDFLSHHESTSHARLEKKNFC